MHFAQIAAQNIEGKERTLIRNHERGEDAILRLHARAIPQVFSRELAASARHSIPLRLGLSNGQATR